MLAWWNWYTVRAQNAVGSAHVGSNPTASTILFTILICLLTVDAQEQETKPDKPIQQTLRPELQDKLCKLLLKRYFQPIEEWTTTKGVNRVLPREPNAEDYYRKDDKEYWFILIVSGDKTKGDSLYVKFYLSWIDLSKFAQWDEEGSNLLGEYWFDEYWTIKKISIAAQIEQCMIEHMDDIEFHESICFGTAHLYRLVTKDTPIDKLRKGDLIY